MWYYNDQEINEEILEGYIGFVYNITNLQTNRKYIGKKLLKSRRTKQVKGVKKKIVIDSDWRKYWGSNKTLQTDVEELGEHNFKREILCLCKGKGELNYLEAKYQFIYGVLESDDYYNEWTMVKVHQSHIKILRK
jgi:hypothetical protein